MEITAEILVVAGEKEPRPGRIYRREGTFEGAGQWFDELNSLISGGLISPGGVGMYVPVSRAAIYKRIQQGQLTAFYFQVSHKIKTYFQTEREARLRPFIYIPVVECKAWAEELKLRQGGVRQAEAEETANTGLGRAEEFQVQKQSPTVETPLATPEPKIEELSEDKVGWL